MVVSVGGKTLDFSDELVETLRNTKFSEFTTYRINLSDTFGPI